MYNQYNQAILVLSHNSLDFSAPMAQHGRMNTIVEFDRYLKKAAKFLSEKERDELSAYLARKPTAGVVIEGTGGVRKLRWARQGGGKSGGVRVIYYFHSPLFPVFLMDLYAKNEKENLSQKERNDLAKAVDALVKQYGKQS